MVISSCSGGGGTSIAADNESPDPVLLDIAIAYIKRPAPAPDNNSRVQINNLFDPIEMFPDAQLLIRPRSSNLAEEIDLTPRIIDIIIAELNVEADVLSIDIKDLESSFDGNKLLFAVRGIPEFEDNDEPELFTWNLWQYDFELDEIGYVIDSALIRNDGAAAGGGQDMAPHFLTDDRIVFSSSRQSAVQEKQLNEGRGQRYSAVSELGGNSQAVALHIIDPDSNEISQISLNRSVDIDPTTLESGEIIFSRIDRDRQTSLFQINPSGGELTAVYGSNSGDLVALEESSEGNIDRIHFLQPREMPDGRILTLLRANNQNSLGGDLALINRSGFAELFTTVNDYSGSDQRGQTSLNDLDINALDELSPGGKYLAAYPLRDGSDRVLVSWSSCRVQNDEGLIIPCSIADDDDRVIPVGETERRLQAAPSLFGLWIFNPNDNTQLPVVIAEDGFVISEIVAAEPRDFPALADEEDIFDTNLAAENKGKIIIDSVYNQDGSLVTYLAGQSISSVATPGTLAYINRPARFIRVLQPVPQPNEDVIEDLPGSGGRYGLLEILGYVPVEPDGSVTVKVPANTPVMLNILDSNGRRIASRHDHWLQVAQGEILRCVGCHANNSDLPHGRPDSKPASSNPGAISLNSGLEGFNATDSSLFAASLGQTMADVYELRKPDGNQSETVRDLQLELSYQDEWTDIAIASRDAAIDLSYDTGWNIPSANAIIAPNLDPALQGRIVINYNDHIQPIWARERNITQDGLEVLGADGNAVTNCIGCHSSNGDTLVPAGQLELSDSIVDGGIFTRSYVELTRNDNELWITSGGGLADRQRLCIDTNEEGVELQVTQFFNVPASVNGGSARASTNFFACFEQDNSPNCGRFMQDVSAPPANCSDDGGTPDSGGTLTTKVIPATFTEAEVLMAALLPTPLSLSTDPQVLSLLQNNCSSCHSTGGGQVPHSDPDNDIAYNAAKDYINLVNPSASTLVFRLATLNHQCGDSNACDSLAAAMELAITTFASAVPIETINNVVPGGSISAQGSFNHYNLLSQSELRLISEWLDIGTPFYNNPFDPRLFP
ncbi:MAG: mono/diheme cytochrome c family protein [Oceanicoccus sp.]|jgi:mono/diheme cytochrome c family protein